MSKTATTRAMAYRRSYFCLNDLSYCCGTALPRLFVLPAPSRGDLIRLRFSTAKMASSRRIRFRLRREVFGGSSLRWGAGKVAIPRSYLVSTLENWLLGHFPKWKVGKVQALYVQVLPGKRGGKPYPVRKD